LQCAKREIGRSVKQGYWLNQANCRKFFCDLAAKKGFDPLIADNWRTITYHETIAAGVCSCSFCCFHFNNDHTQGGSVIAKFHNRYREAIQAAFPELEFDPKWVYGMSSVFLSHNFSLSARFSA
jgi:hypothetical protein